MSTLKEIGYNILNDFQKDILKECLVKKSGGLSVVLGGGKTILSIVLGLFQKVNKNPMLVIVSKTLLESWKFEIHKFFGDKLKYIIFHSEYNKNMTINESELNNIDLVLTTADVVSKYYKTNDIESNFIKKIIINQGRFNQHIINYYNKPIIPNGNVNGNILYAIKWSVLIIDEAQAYSNIESQRCRGIGSISADFRWAVSGTLFNEPKTERILGYYIMINHNTFPRTLPDALKLIKSSTYKGYIDSIVERTINIEFKEPKVNEIIITHEMFPEEQIIYINMKESLKNINKILEIYKANNDIDNTRKFSSYILAMIGYLRQCVVCPLLPIAKCSLDAFDFNNKSELSKIVMKQIENMNIPDFFDNPESIRSSRICKVLEILDKPKHINEKIVIFTCFRTTLDVIKHFIENKRKALTITSVMNMKKRASVIKEFQESNNGILLLTYDIGAAGLNLQCSKTVLLVSSYWNNSTTEQAIGRIFRFGQLEKEVDVYYFMSNTAIEKALYQKQFDKQNCLTQLKTGPQETKVQKINIKDIIKFINMEDNLKLSTDIRKKT